jgi:hypothetical protein
MPAQDDGASGAWQTLLKLRATASAMHTTAHPDDEHGGRHLTHSLAST